MSEPVKFTEEEMSGVKDIQKQFLDEITKKYGDGTLNPDTGIFTPNKQ